MQKSQHRVIIPVGTTKYPEPHEYSAAEILANYYNCNIYFMQTRNIRTADIRIRGVEWEIKSPKGKGKRTLQHQFDRACKQCCNMILDLRRYNMHNNRAVNEAIRQFRLHQNIKKLIIIQKRERNLRQEKVMFLVKH